MMWKFIIGFILIYFVVRFVLRFVLPIFKIVKSTQQKMNDINGRVNNMEEAAKKEPPKPKSKKVGEYIDYEEIK